MKKHPLIALAAILFCALPSSAQKYISSKEGRAVLNKQELVFNCLHSLNKNRSDKTALAICECQVDKLDGRFTNKQINNHTTRNIIDISGLIQEDSLVNKEIQACYTNSGKTMLLQAEGFEADFLSNCTKSIQGSSQKTLDAQRVANFCSCQLQMVREKKLSDAEMQTLSNPNSVLFYEMIYKCGDPFATKEDDGRNWIAAASNDVKGPAIDTIPVLNLNGMTFVKLKIGSSVQVWLFDTGASDLLINQETEAQLKKENIIGQSNYLGTGEYEMANGMVDTCRRYRINNVQIGDFTVDNVVVSVSDKGKRIIVGKALLNKFRAWSLNNQASVLVLAKQ